MFNDNYLSYETAQTALPNLKLKERFERILDYLDTIKPDNQEQSKKIIKQICNQMPDSCLLHIIAGWAFDPPEDEPYYQKAVETAPESNFVRTAYGHHLLAYNKLKKATEQFQMVTEQDPNHIFAYYGQLSALVKTDPNAAEILGLELTKQWPENAGFCFEYSKALRAKNKRKEELPVIQKAIELCSENDVPYQYQSYLASSLMANKYYEKSEQAYKKLLKTHECEHCWWSYTTLLLKMGPDKIEQAKKACDKTVTFIHDPNTVSKKQRIYEAAMEKMLSDPNKVGVPN